MNGTVDLLGRQVELSPATLSLAVGDLLAVGAFVVVGELTHGIDPVAQPARVAGTMLPFVVGWGLAALLAGLYAADGRRSVLRAVELTVPAWLFADLVGQLLRATPVFPGNADVTFFLVTAVVGGAFIVAWRAVATRVIGP